LEISPWRFARARRSTRAGVGVLFTDSDLAQRQRKRAAKILPTNALSDCSPAPRSDQQVDKRNGWSTLPLLHVPAVPDLAPKLFIRTIAHVQEQPSSSSLTDTMPRGPACTSEGNRSMVTSDT